MARKRIEVTRSVAIGLAVVQQLLDQVPSWSEIEEYELVLGTIREDSADVGDTDCVTFCERELVVVLGRRAPVAWISLIESGWPTKWRVSDVAFRELEEPYSDEEHMHGVQFCGKNGWTTKKLGARKHLPFMVIQDLNCEIIIAA